MEKWPTLVRGLGLLGLILMGGTSVRGAEDGRVAWGLAHLRNALLDAGYVPGEIAIEADLKQSEREHNPESYSLGVNPGLIRITAGDTAGILYGCLDAASRIRAAGELPVGFEVTESPTMSMRGPCILLMKLGAYNFSVSPEEFPFFYDRELWIRWLDFMAEQRFNTLTLWNGHPFAYFVPFDRYSEAQEGMPPGLVETNREMLHWLVEEGGKRNIRLIFEFYNIHTSVYFQEAHDLPDEVSEPDPLLRDYTAYAVERFVSEFPEIGLHITPGEALDLAWTDRWVNDVLYPAVERGGIRAPVIVRSWGVDLPHAGKIAAAHPETWFERKFNVEMIADTRADPENVEWAALTGKHVVNIHMAANLEPFRWSPPDYIRQCVLGAIETGAGGLHLYPRKSWRWPESSEPGNPQLQWERDRMWYEAWGRYAWRADRDPVTEKSWWLDRLTDDFGGLGAAERLLESMNTGADVLPQIQRLVWLGNDNHTVVTAGIRLSQLEKAEGIPFMDLPEVAQRIPEFLETIRSGAIPPQPTPLTVLEAALAKADRAAGLAREASSLAHRRKAELEAWARDAEAVRLTTRFYLEKLEAAVLRAESERSAAPAAPDAFLAPLTRSVSTFHELAALTEGYYDSLSDVPMWFPVRLKKVPYHWVDVVPLYEKEEAMYRELIEGQAEEPSTDPVHEGLIGLLYGDPGLRRPREMDRAEVLEFDWGVEDPGRGRHWSVEWQGFLLPPGAGDCELMVESDQPVRLEVAGAVLLDFAAGAGEHRLFVSTGTDHAVPFRLAYDHREGPTGRLRIRWSRDGVDFTPIPTDALRHSDRERRWVDQALFMSEL
ncbi:MAG: PA14 domain-containing protein [Opitutaceae bacterium]